MGDKYEVVCISYGKQNENNNKTETNPALTYRARLALSPSLSAQATLASSRLLQESHVGMDFTLGIPFA